MSLWHPRFNPNPDFFSWSSEQLALPGTRLLGKIVDALESNRSTHRDYCKMWMHLLLCLLLFHAHLRWTSGFMGLKSSQRARLQVDSQFLRDFDDAPSELKGVETLLFDTQTASLSFPLNRRETLAGSAAALSFLPLMKDFLDGETLPNDLSAISGISAAALQGDTIVRNLWLSRLTYPVLIVALETGIFEALKNKPLMKEELGRRMTPKLQGGGRILEAILAVLVSLELLQVKDDKVSLTEASRAVLLKDSPYFWGSQLLAADGLTSSLRRAIRTEDSSMVKDYSVHSDATIGSFIDSMQAHGSVTAQSTAQALEPWIGRTADAPARRVLDMAGGSGCFAAALAARGIPVTLADLPTVVARWRKQNNNPLMANKPNRKLLDAVPVDLFAADTWPIGPDVHLMANVLHDWGEAQVLSILQASHAVLQKTAQSKNEGNGTSSENRLIVIEQLLNNNRSGPLPAALASVSMLLGDWRTGKQYSYVELKTFMKQAGFRSVELGPKCGEFHTAVIAHV